MATLYADHDGEVIRWLESADMEAMFPEPPDGSSVALSFDPEFNQELWKRLCESTKGAVVTATAVKYGKETFAIAERPASRNPDSIKQIASSSKTAVMAAKSLEEIKAAIAPLFDALINTVEVAAEAKKPSFGSAEDVEIIKAR